MFLFLTGTVIWPAQVRAQQSSSKVSRVAFFYPGTIGDAELPVWEAFLSAPPTTTAPRPHRNAGHARTGVMRPERRELMLPPDLTCASSES